MDAANMHRYTPPPEKWKRNARQPRLERTRRTHKSVLTNFLAVDIRVGTVIAAEPFPGGAKTVAETSDRFRPGHRAQEDQRADHRVLRARRSARPAGCGGGEFSAAPDRQVHVRGSDAGFFRTQKARWCCSSPIIRCRTAAACSTRQRPAEPISPAAIRWLCGID